MTADVVIIAAVVKCLCKHILVLNLLTLISFYIKKGTYNETDHSYG